MSFIDDLKKTNLGSHDLVPSKPKKSVKTESAKLKPRFSVNLTDTDFDRVIAHCEKTGMNYAALTRMLLLRELDNAEKNA